MMNHFIPRPAFRCTVAALMLLLGNSAATALGVDNWTNFRGPTDQGRADEAKLPIKWSETENVVWKTPVEGKAWSSPVVWEDRVYLTNANPEGTRLSVVALDKNTGEVIYDKLLHTVVLPQYCHPFNSYASPSPVIEDGRLYVSFGSPYNACLDAATGDVLWQRTDFVCNHFRGPGSSPMLFEDRLILHFDGSDLQYVVALDKQTGETLWRTDRTVNYDDVDAATGQIKLEGDMRKAYSTPIVIDVQGEPLLVSLGSMALYGYSPRDGQEQWRVDFVGSHSGACRPVLHNGLIYFSTGSGGELWAIKPDGAGVLDSSHVVWKQKRAVPKRSSIVIVDHRLYMVDDMGVASCVSTETGEELWRERLGGNFSASLIHADGRIYFFDQEGQTNVIKTGDEFEVLATNELETGLYASPAVSGRALFVRTPTHLYRLEDRVGKN
ncbi:MAG: PQQ-binding-like beta-propeller repeat protein [Pirellulales bacterium]|nr:PQQ-binding-like beta-propeller repeat protein [Pirellulales bacterium]